MRSTRAEALIRIDQESKEIKSKAYEYMQTKNPSLKDQFIRWIQLRNVCNMEKVCNSFFEGRLHYSKGKDEWFDTSLNELERVYLQATRSSVLVTSNIFRVKSNSNAAEVLQALLFSYTKMDCRGAVNIAFYFTFYDMIVLYYGEKAPFIFNKLFGGKRPLQERLTFGSLTNTLCLDREELISPLQYFGETIPKVSFSDLQERPEKYLGAQFYIKGHPEYFIKHRKDEQGWNVIFCGHNEKKQALFLGARGEKEEFCLTYSKFKKLLAQGYNKFPEISEKKYAANVCSTKDIVGLLSYGVSFNFDKLLEITDTETLGSHLHQFIKVFQMGKNPQINVEKSDFFLMLTPKTGVYKNSDSTHIYLYQNELGGIFYRIKNKTFEIPSVKELKVIDKTKFDQPENNPVKCNSLRICEAILDITSKRGHTPYNYEKEFDARKVVARRIHPFTAVDTSNLPNIPTPYTTKPVLCVFNFIRHSTFLYRGGYVSAAVQDVISYGKTLNQKKS